MFKLDVAAESEVLAARQLVKQTLESIYGHVSTITVEEWMFQQQSKPVEPFGRHGVGDATRRRGNGHRRMV